MMIGSLTLFRIVLVMLMPVQLLHDDDDDYTKG